jgi:hypothetical protein
MVHPPAAMRLLIELTKRSSAGPNGVMASVVKRARNAPAATLVIAHHLRAHRDVAEQDLAA